MEFNRLYKRSLRKINKNPIDKGIENLFSSKTIEKAIQHKPAFIDIHGAQKITLRGEEKNVPETKMVNNDEKTNLCNWLCANGTKDDFENFHAVFEIIENVFVPKS